MGGKGKPMKNAHAIYWYLYWNFSIENLNEKVRESWLKNNFEDVKFFCKIIAIKVSGINTEDFWNKYIKTN